MNVITREQATANVSAGLRSRLQIKCWTVQDLIDALDGAVPHNTVHRIARGDNVGAGHHLVAIAGVLGCTVDTLLTGKP
jgi:hypothetical protein